MNYSGRSGYRLKIIRGGYGSHCEPLCGGLYNILLKGKCSTVLPCYGFRPKFHNQHLQTYKLLGDPGGSFLTRVDFHLSVDGIYLNTIVVLFNFF